MLEDLAQQHNVQFPTLDFIRKVYQGLANYLQVPLGTEQVSYAFDLKDFLNKFSFRSRPAQAALQLLQQEGFITLTDPVVTPVNLCFTCDRQLLTLFEAENPVLEPLVKHLLRSYAGIFDQPVSIQEKSLASSLNWSPGEVRKGLITMHRHQIVQYNPQKETPQVYYHLPRRKAADIFIDDKVYQFRKEQFIRRVKGMLDYVGTNACRSVAMAEYFGVPGSEPCGICDNCVKREKEKMSPAELDAL